MCADLNELLSQLGPEVEQEVDWNAPEQGSFPPVAGPGTYEFIFHLPDSSADQFKVQERKGETGQVIGKDLQVSFNAELVSNGDGQPLVPLEDGSNRVAMFQRISDYRSDKMTMSQAAELVRCLGLVEDIKAQTGGKLTRPALITALQQADGRARGSASFIWRAYFPDTKTTVSTKPRKGKGKRADEVAWPKNADGTFAPMATDPATGDKAYGKLEISSFKVKKVQ